MPSSSVIPSGKPSPSAKLLTYVPIAVCTFLSHRSCPIILSVFETVHIMFISIFPEVPSMLPHTYAFKLLLSNINDLRSDLNP